MTWPTKNAADSFFPAAILFHLLWIGRDDFVDDLLQR